MANWYVDSVAYTAVAQWQAAHVYAAGSIVRQLAAPSVGNERCFRTSAGGTSHATTEPVWVLTKGSSSPTDNTITDWVEVTGNETYQGAGGTAWKAPHARIQCAFATGWMASGDTCYVGNDHAETQASSVTISSAIAIASLICVSATSSIPPVASDITTGAVMAVTGANSLTFRAVLNFYCQGMTFQAAGGGANAGSYAIGAANHFRAVNCNFQNLGSASGNYNNLSNSSSIVENCTFKFSHANATTFVSGKFRMVNCPNPIDLTGSQPTSLSLLYTPNDIVLEACDFSKLTAPAVSLPGVGFTGVAKDCRIGSGGMFSAATTPAQEISLIRCAIGASGETIANSKISYGGTTTTDLVVVRTGGASDGASFSHKIITTANASWIFPHPEFMISIWNTVLQNNINVTLEGIADPTTFSALPNNDDFWIDVEYLSRSDTPLGVINSGTKANMLATGAALTASTQAWDSLANARVASTAYTTGQIIKVGTNTGRLFICTTSGNSSNDATGTAYSSAVDGGTVNESAAGSGGTAVFKAMWRFKQTVTLASPQPQMVGPITVYPKMAKASATLWLDPLITLS